MSVDKILLEFNLKKWFEENKEALNYVEAWNVMIQHIDPINGYLKSQYTCKVSLIEKEKEPYLLLQRQDMDENNTIDNKNIRLYGSQIKDIEIKRSRDTRPKYNIYAPNYILITLNSDDFFDDVRIKKEEEKRKYDNYMQYGIGGIKQNTMKKTERKVLYQGRNRVLYIGARGKYYVRMKGVMVAVHNK
jgi:hypothetical protein